MPDKQLTIVAYAAGASLAAITLVYVFAPTFFLDGDSTGINSSSKKRAIVGLSNPANDCFINAVLQALAGLADLRVYLIRETHRRKLDGINIYSHVAENLSGNGMPSWKLEGLQMGTVTQGLKEILNALNERPIYKKTISAGTFIKVLEEAFRQKISLQQQDAQEFLQVVAERLCDEYHAGKKARYNAKIANGKNELIKKADELSSQVHTELLTSEVNSVDSIEVVSSGASEIEAKNLKNSSLNEECNSLVCDAEEKEEEEEEEEEGFPLEGGSESQIECLTCGFKPKPTTSTFCSLTLSLPQVSSTTLSSCFDQMFKTEYIEDFKCEKCRLIHALETIKDQVSRSTSESFRKTSEKSIEVIQAAIENNPEEDLGSIEMPDLKFAPKRKIARHVRITNFPKVMAIHLSRSIFDAGHCTLKNSAKVSFPEQLPLGGLLNQNFYRLSSVVCHKGSHNSGHYESFRRQTIYPPFSTPNTFKPAKVYSKTSSATPSFMTKPQTSVCQTSEDQSIDISLQGSFHKSISPVSTSSSSSTLEKHAAPGQVASDSCTSNISKLSEKKDIAKLRARARTTLSKVSSLTPKRTETNGSIKRLNIYNNVRQKGKKAGDRWWRISDDKISESKTADVLGMQREVYLLFYELERKN